MTFVKSESPVSQSSRQEAVVLWTGWLCVIAAVSWIGHRVWPALFIPWWFNTDEVVFYAEVIRQLRLDPSQTFFDIPGTPFMTVTSVLTAFWWALARLGGWTRAANPSDFAFANVQGVFTLMRALTLALYVGAVAIAFDLFRRCAGVLVALLAVLLFATLPIHVHYSYFVRTESLGLVFSLGAICMILYSRWRGTPKGYFLAGCLAGAAMAARFHFALAGLPVLLAVFLLKDRCHALSEDPRKDHSRLYSVAAGLSVFFVFGAVLALALKAKWIGPSWLTHTLMLTSPGGPAQFARAKEVVAMLWLLLGLLGTGVIAFVWMPQARRRLWTLLNPFTLMLGLGFAAGFVVSHPEFLWRGEQQLQSIQFYADWTDPKLQGLGPLASWWNVSSYYFTNALPERWVQIAFLGGVVVTLWRRQAVHVAILAGGALCFLAHPVTMKLWPHHVIPWLAFLCFVAALPVGLLVDWLFGRHALTPAVRVVTVLLAAATLTWACSARLRKADEYLITSRARTDQIAEMSRWLSAHVPSDSYLLVSYFALNEDGFLRYIENAGVSVPPFVQKHRNVKIWWLEREAIHGRAGIVCISRADISFFLQDFERKKPGSTYNPFENPAFKLLAKFGGGFYELGVFQFDFKNAEARLGIPKKDQHPW